MKRHRMGRMQAIGGLALTLLTVACGTPAGTWGAPAASHHSTGHRVLHPPPSYLVTGGRRAAHGACAGRPGSRRGRRNVRRGREGLPVMASNGQDPALMRTEIREPPGTCSRSAIFSSSTNVRT